MPRIFCVAHTVIIALLLSFSAAAETLFYPRPEADFDERTGYPLTLLRLIFSNEPSLQKYQLKPTDIRMTRGRSLKLLEQGVAIDVFWSITSKQREEKLLAIKIPIYEGLFGYRLLMIQNGQQDKFPKDLSETELQQRIAGLAHDWPDYRILLDNQYSVQGSASYQSLFRMLMMKRVDYLPRSVLEIWPEYEHFSGQGLQVEENIALYYPVEFYYFVNKNNKALAANIEKGLKQIVEDGSKRLLFDMAHDGLIQQSRLRERKIFKLKNTLVD